MDQPYRLDQSDRLTTDLTINGKGPFNFVLDTATSTSFLFAATRDRLGLSGAATGPSFDTYGLNNVVKAEPLILDEVKLSGLTFRQMRMGLIEGKSSIDGILGIDVVDKYTLVLNRDQMRLQLISADDAAPQPWRDWPSVEMSPDTLQTVGSTFWHTQAEFNGRPLKALLDLGAGITIINWAAAERLGIPRQVFNSAGPPDKRLRDFLGSPTPAVNILTAITIGGQYFSNQRVLIANAKVFEFAGMANVPAALIGTGLLGDRSLAVDFPGHKLYIGPQARPSR